MDAYHSPSLSISTPVLSTAQSTIACYVAETSFMSISSVEHALSDDAISVSR